MAGNETGMDHEFEKRKNKFCTRVILGTFQLACFGLVGYMVFVQVKTFCANEDLSIIAYRNFKDGTQDVFPTFSICAFGEIWILKTNKMPQNHSVMESQFISW